MKKFNIGQCVYWNDPEGVTSGCYDVIDNHEIDYQEYTDEDIKDFDDRIILIGNGVSEIEAYAGELRDISSISINEMKSLIEPVCEEFILTAFHSFSSEL